MSVAATAAAESNCNSSLASVDAISSLHWVSAGLLAELYSVWAIQAASGPPPLRRPEDRLTVYGAPLRV